MWSILPVFCGLVALSTARNLGRNLGKRTTDDYMRLIQGGNRYDPFHEECAFEVEDRLPCGKATFEEGECVTRGCCFEQCTGEECNWDVPWCFLAKRMLRDECKVAYEAKEDCGRYGITEGECYMRGCCWAPSPLPNDPPCFHGISVKLLDGSQTDTTYSGRVEIKHDSQWGTVCDDNFDQNAANVVCRALGYPHAEPKGYAYYGEGSGQILLDGFRCDGTEDRIESCANINWGENDCSHSEDAGVICSSEDPEPEYYYTMPPDYYYTYGPDYYYGYNYGYNYGEDGEDGEEEETNEVDIYNDDDLPWSRMRGRNGFKGKPAQNKKARKAKRSDMQKAVAHHNKKARAAHAKKQKATKRGAPTKKHHKKQ